MIKLMKALGVKEAPLIVQHNVRADKLAAADKLGGLPVPSLAVSKADAPLTNFGDISLIAPKEFAKPSTKNPVYRSDAYTARRPRIEVEVSKKGIDKLADVFGIDTYSAKKLSQDFADRGELRYSDAVQRKFLADTGRLPEKGNMNNWEYSSLISNLASDSPYFDDYINKFVSELPSMGIDTSERIFKGYTQSGNRRYAPATLDNIVKEMKGGANTEGFSYGIGNLRAVAQPKFRTFDQVQASRGNVLPSSEFEPIAKSLSDEYSNVTGLLSGAGRYDAGDALLEAAEKRNPEVLRRLYPNLDEASFEQARGLLGRLSDPNLPTEYFEVKPQRAVGLNEFSGAIVPGDASGSTIDILRRGGIENLQFYEPGSVEDRIRKFMQFPNQMFSAGAVAPAGLLAIPNNEE
jgi:hypothetical protein